MLHSKKRARLKAEQKRIAEERIDKLFKQAAKRPDFAKRYVRLARKIAQRYTVSIPQKWKRKFCKKCNAFLTAGKNSTVRMRDKTIIIHCEECGNIKRIKT